MALLIDPAITAETGVKEGESSTPKTPAEGTVVETVKEGEAIVKTGDGVKDGVSLTPEDTTAQETKKREAQKRILGLLGDVKGKESLIAEKEQRIKALEAELSKKPTFITPMPKRDEYESDEAFDKAYGGWIDAKLDHRVQEQVSRIEIKAVETQAKKAWEPFIEIASKLDESQYPGLDEAISGKGVMYSPLSKEFVQNSSVGPQLAYHFYKNPDLALKVAQMNVVDQSQALLDLQSEFVKTNASRSKSSAPAPITPVGGGSSVVEPDEDKMPIGEWMAKYGKPKK